MAQLITKDNLTSLGSHIYQDTPNFIYLHHVKDPNSSSYGVILYLPEYTTSDSVTDTTGINFSETAMLSRSAPIQSFINAGPRSVQFTFDLHRDMMRQINYGKSNFPISDENDDYVDLFIKYIQAGSLPSYAASTKMVNPPIVSIKMGSDIFITGVIKTGVGVTYKYPILRNGKYATINIGFTITEITPYDADMVMKIGSYRIPTSLAAASTYTDGTSAASASYGYVKQNSITEDKTYTSQSIYVRENRNLASSSSSSSSNNNWSIYVRENR